MTPPHDSVSLALSHLVNASLQRCCVGQKLVVKSGLLYCPFYIVAKPQVMDDGLEGKGMGSAWPRGRGWRGQVDGTYQCGGRSDVRAPRGTHHHADLAILAHEDRRTHGREGLLPCGHQMGRQGQRCWSAACPGHQPFLAQVPPCPTPGLMKLAGEGGTPNWLVMLGELKSSISSLNMIPLTCERTLEPKLQTSRIRQLCQIQPLPHPAPTHPPKLHPAQGG